jgi:hypothetical protein
LEFESPESIRYLQWHPQANLEQEYRLSSDDIHNAVDVLESMSSPGKDQ